MSDLSKVLLTDSTDISVRKKWVYWLVYITQKYEEVSHTTQKVGVNRTKKLATSVLAKVDLCAEGVDLVHSDMDSYIR